MSTFKKGFRDAALDSLKKREKNKFDELAMQTFNGIIDIITDIIASIMTLLIVIYLIFTVVTLLL